MRSDRTYWNRRDVWPNSGRTSDETPLPGLLEAFPAGPPASPPGENRLRRHTGQWAVLVHFVGPVVFPVVLGHDLGFAACVNGAALEYHHLSAAVEVHGQGGVDSESLQGQRCSDAQVKMVLPPDAPELGADAGDPLCALSPSRHGG